VCALEENYYHFLDSLFGNKFLDGWNKCPDLDGMKFTGLHLFPGSEKNRKDFQALYKYHPKVRKMPQALPITLDNNNPGYVYYPSIIGSI